MSERNASGQLTSEAGAGGAPATHGIIDHLRILDQRVQRIEDKLWPHADGSGTARYADNWTQTGDGTDYPGSYGVGPVDTLKVGDTVRVTSAEGVVDPEARKVTSVSNGLVYTDGILIGYPRDHVVVVKPDQEQTA